MFFLSDPIPDQVAGNFTACLPKFKVRRRDAWFADPHIYYMLLYV